LTPPTIAAGGLGNHHKLVAAAAPQDTVDFVHVSERASAFGGDKTAHTNRTCEQDRHRPTNEIKNIKKPRKSTKYRYFANLNQ